jgi:hypothetical protein
MTSRRSRRRVLGAAILSLTGCAVASETTDSAWELGIDESISWETVHVLSQRSRDSIADEYATKQVHPVLDFRCTEGGGAMAMRIDWQRFVSSFSTEAGFQVDGHKRSWLKLGVDDSNRITLSRSAADVEALVASLSGGDTLNVEIEPYSEPSVSVNFDLAGFDAAIASLEAACR